MGVGAPHREEGGLVISSAPERGLFDLQGRVALVTGGGRGLGLAVARALAQHGARVAIAGRDQATLAAAADELERLQPGCRAHVVDVAQEESVAVLDAWLDGEFGRLDVLVNNAGINPFYRAAESTPMSEWQQVIDVNLTGVFLCCRVFGARMLARREGSIINVSSVAGHVGLAKTAAYCAAKGGVELLTKSLALEWAGQGVRVNTIAPGYFETDLTAGMRDHPVLADRLLRKTPLGRFGVPAELGGAAVFLASAASSYVTGQSVLVDGGWTAA